jgi:hypothetical protein
MVPVSDNNNGRHRGTDAVAPKESRAFLRRNRSAHGREEERKLEKGFKEDRFHKL